MIPAKKESVKEASRISAVTFTGQPGAGREELSQLLRRLRESAGLSGRRAAAVAGFGQPKLSKIENGLLLPSRQDADALCTAYGVSAAQRDRVLDLVTELHGDMESARVILRRGAYRLQQRIAKIEAETTLHRAFDLGAVIGLLQTPDYMRQVFSRRLSEPEQDKAIAARLERQRILADETKTFSFVMTEGALRWQAGSAGLMAAQLDRLAEESRRPNVCLGVIPWTRPVRVFPGHEFHLYDDRLALVGIETALATITDPADIYAYADLFTELERLADFDDAARQTLARIAADYRMLAH
jgi:transcriptional regulator with XRE-family HTH domain